MHSRISLILQKLYEKAIQQQLKGQIGKVDCVFTEKTKHILRSSSSVNKWLSSAIQMIKAIIDSKPDEKDKIDNELTKKLEFLESLGVQLSSSTKSMGEIHE